MANTCRVVMSNITFKLSDKETAYLLVYVRLKPYLYDAGDNELS